MKECPFNIISYHNYKLINYVKGVAIMEILLNVYYQK